MTNLGESALAYAACGWHVFPLQPRTKEPLLGSRGFHGATTDAARIAAWWRSVPELNIGIATGAVSGFFALDIDGEDGEASLRHLESEHGKLPPTREIITGRGGRHCYFNAGKHHVKCSVAIVGDKLDIRGDGGYVVAPPSIHQNGRAYCWSVDGADQLAEAPHWLLQRIEVANAVNGKGKPLEQWHHLLTNQIPSGQRNTTLTSICGKLLHAGLKDPVLLYDCLLNINIARCTPPLAECDIETIAVSVLRGHLRKVAPNVQSTTAHDGR